MKAILIFGLVALCGGVFAQDNPGSLWSDTAPNRYRDRTARGVGDVVTIIISESSASKIAATTTANKKDSNKVGFNFFANFLNGIFQPYTTNADSSVSGDGSTSRTGTMTARMSAIVRKVMPNGNLVIEGTRSLATNKETQIYKLSGIVRPDDIRADNTVRSENIAEAEIRMDGKGLISDRQRRGIITRILDWLF